MVTQTESIRLDVLFTSNPDAFYDEIRAQALRKANRDEALPSSVRKQSLSNLASKFGRKTKRRKVA